MVMQKSLLVILIVFAAIGVWVVISAVFYGLWRIMDGVAKESRKVSEDLQDLEDDSEPIRYPEVARQARQPQWHTVQYEISAAPQEMTPQPPNAHVDPAVRAEAERAFSEVRAGLDQIAEEMNQHSQELFQRSSDLLRQAMGSLPSTEVRQSPRRGASPQRADQEGESQGIQAVREAETTTRFERDFDI